MAQGRVRPNDDDDYDDDRYFDLDELVRYSKLSLSTLRRYLKAAEHPLPHLVVRSPGRTAGRGHIVVRKRAFDAWMEQTFAPQPRADRRAGEQRDPTDASWITRAFDRR